MLSALTQLYDHLILKRPVYPVLVCVLITLLFAFYIPDFKLDASADSLVLENDKALKIYRSIKARYGSDDFLIITYTPEKDLFSEPVLDDIRKKGALLVTYGGKAPGPAPLKKCLEDIQRVLDRYKNHTMI